MKKTAVNIYYLCLVLTVIVMAGYTVFSGSQQLANGHRIAVLEAQKQVLVAQQNTLSQNTARELSLGTVTAFATSNGFVPMTQPIALTSTVKQVALR